MKACLLADSSGVVRRAVKSLVVCGLLATAACVPSSAPLQADAPTQVDPLADELFAAGDYVGAIEAYGQEIDEATDVDQLARLRLLRALARLAEGDARGEREAITELRAIELGHGTRLWGRIARIYVLELTRRDALREAIMQAGADLRATEQELQLVEERLYAAEQVMEEQERGIGSLKDERKKLQRQIDALTEQAQAQSERITELQRELEALKQIDMKRKP
jgi:DNA repair exonuclease SbcCD ATPase subunit